MHHTTFFTHNASLYCLTHKECFHHPTPEPPPTKETKTFWQKNESIHHHLKVLPRICGPSQKGGWTEPHDRNVEFLYTYTASPMFGGDYWEKSIKEPLLFRCNDQQTERSNQQVLPQQKSTIPPLIEHKLSEYLYLNHKSSYIMLCLEKKTRTLERAERRMNQTTLHKQRAWHNSGEKNHWPKQTQTRNGD